MANIVRCELPDGVKRFKAFTVSDYRDLILVRGELENKPRELQIQMLDEVLEEYFGEYPKTWRPYIFVSVFCTSLGKIRIPVFYECPKCEKKKRFFVNLQQEPLKNPVLETLGVKIHFKFPTERTDDLVRLVEDNISSVEDESGIHPWDSLDNETKLALIDSLEYKEIEKLISQLSPISFKQKFGCCGDKHELNYTEVIDVFKLLVNPDEVINFYRVNHLLVKSHYDLNSIMQMMPAERVFALSLVEKDLKKK